MTSRFAFVVAACALGAWLPSASALSAQSQGSPRPVPTDAAVDFGVLPLARNRHRLRVCNPGPSAARPIPAPTCCIT